MKSRWQQIPAVSSTVLLSRFNSVGFSLWKLLKCELTCLEWLLIQTLNSVVRVPVHVEANSLRVFITRWWLKWGVVTVGIGSMLMSKDVSQGLPHVANRRVERDGYGGSMPQLIWGMPWIDGGIAYYMFVSGTLPALSFGMFMSNCKCIYN